MNYSITLHIEVEAEDIDAACGVAEDITNAIYNFDLPEVSIGSVTIGDVEQLDGDDEV
jgi:hypothetical protein